MMLSRRSGKFGGVSDDLVLEPWSGLGALSDAHLSGAASELLSRYSVCVFSFVVDAVGT